MPTEIVSPAPLAGGNRAGIRQALEQLSDTTVATPRPRLDVASAAESYARRLGWPICPIGRLSGPRPEYASADPAVIAKWWAMLPDARIELATGSALAVDIGQQINRGEFERWRDGRSVVTARSAAGRTMLFYRKPATYWGIPSQRLAHNIQLFGAWDFVLLPPSADWHWLQSPFEAELADLWPPFIAMLRWWW
jgi:hypothetical protein